jgi:hypothetical protein
VEAAEWNNGDSSDREVKILWLELIWCSILRRVFKKIFFLGVDYLWDFEISYSGMDAGGRATA